MDFSWPPEYTAYRDRVITFARHELTDDLRKRDREGVFPRHLWDKCAAFGIQGLAAPARLGGSHPEVDILRATLAMESLGYACSDNGLALALSAHMWTVQMTIVAYGNEDQQERFVPPMARGEWIGVHCLTEPNTGSDAYSLETTARKVEGGYLLNGKKRLITLGPLADVAVVFANAKPEVGKWGITAFIVKAEQPGFKRSAVQEKMGLRTVPIGEITFEDCFVPESDRLGREGSGMSISNHSLEYDRCCILAGQLGAMARQLEQSVTYAKERQQFGQPIGKFQAVSHRLADMKLRLETARLLLYKLAWLKQQGKSAMLEAAMLKLHLGESFVESSLDAIRIHGGNGYLSENEIERDLRDAVGGVIYAGTSDVQRNIIASLMGL